MFSRFCLYIIGLFQIFPSPANFSEERFQISCKVMFWEQFQLENAPPQSVFIMSQLISLKEEPSHNSSNKQDFIDLSDSSMVFVIDDVPLSKVKSPMHLSSPYPN